MRSWRSKPFAILWHYPGRGTCASNVKDHAPSKSNPLPIKSGTLLRHGDLLGFVLKQREVEGIPIYENSVAVSCTYSLGRFPDLDQSAVNVWLLSQSQVLEGGLLRAAEEDPERTLRRFMELEEKVKAKEYEQRKACPPKPRKKKPPVGKSR